MPISLKLVSEELSLRDLVPPELDVLKPNNQNYRCLLLQPSGPVYADSTRIGHLDREKARTRCKGFLQLASDSGAHLAITPEYCLPWSVLTEAVQGPLFPALGHVWALGCESVTPEELSAFKGSAQAHCEVVHEELVGAATGSYYDPLVYLFQATGLDEKVRRVALIQFKTGASRDEHFFENAHLKCGNLIYQFKNADSLLSLAAIICSDAFTIYENQDVLRNVVDRSILLHVQLNPDPRHQDYSQYRKFAFSRDVEASNCDLVCLNWAWMVEQYEQGNGDPERWNNIGGSSWYVPMSRCSNKDVEIEANHKMGVYFTTMRKVKRHALLLNYEESVFELDVTKALSTGAGVVANKTGPLAIRRYNWDEASSAWTANPESPASGFDALLEADAEVTGALQQMAGASPIAIERMLALTSGSVSFADDWYDCIQLDSLQLESDEVVHRITFAQDTNKNAATFRHDRLQRAAELNNALHSSADWPPQVKNVFANSRLFWNLATPHCNVAVTGGLPASIVHLGLRPSTEAIRSCVDGLYELLRRENRPHRLRMCVCFTRNEKLEFAEILPLTRIDFGGGSTTDITEALVPIGNS
jgi:predicted amidohydrolase